MRASIFFLFLTGLLISVRTDAQSGGGDIAQLFQLKCGICHTIGQGPLVGPDLSGVNEKYSEEWLVEFIRSSQTMIKKGDPTAVALFEENNKVIMPDPMISDNEIRGILKYIAENSGTGGTAIAYESILANTGPENVERGSKLFDGRITFDNGAASCISCHNGLSNTLFNQKSYAKELSISFSTLGEQGVRAILENPPFPVMAKALEKNPLKADEVRDLLAYMKSVDTGSAASATTPDSGLFIYGILGALSLIIVYSGLWYSRKVRSVNHGIYKRQIRSLN